MRVCARPFCATFLHPTLFTVGLTVLIDQLSKYFVRKLICLHKPVPIIEDVFYLTYVRNPGAAFGLLPYQTELLIGSSVLTIAVLTLLALRISGASTQIAFGLVIGGAIGNLVDRIFSGYVTDFLDIDFWPVFNIADAAIAVGSAIIIWKLLKGHL